MTIFNNTLITLSVPGTCGELVQGWHPDWKQPVLVSCPIELYSRVEITLRPDTAWHVTGNQPVSFTKVRKAVELALAELGQFGGGATITVTSQLLPGRGMASSTADVVGAMAGLAQAYGAVFSPDALARLACRIEPSDSTMFPALTALAYRNSGRYEEMGPVPPLPLLLLDPGQVVDTLAFNAALDTLALQKLGPTTRVALDYVQAGITQADPLAIGAAATLSAEQYQSFCFNPLLKHVKRWARETGAVGLVRAHSGSVIGLLYRPGVDLTDLARWLAARFKGGITPTRLVPGGAQINCQLTMSNEQLVMSNE